MRRAVAVLVRIGVAATGIAVIGGLAGFLVAHFAHWGAASKGFGWGMVIAGVAVSLVGGNMDSPVEGYAEGRGGPNLGGWSALGGWSWGGTGVRAPSGLERVLGGMLALGAGVAVIFLFAYR